MLGNERERAVAASAEIPGWLTPDEAGWLFDAASRVPASQAVVEIGSFLGRSTAALALGASSGAGARVVAVDPHTGSAETAAAVGFLDTFERFRENLRRAGADGQVDAVREFSVLAAARRVGPVGLLFVDGAHDAASVRADWEAWRPRLAPGARAAFHDSWISPFPGPFLLLARELLSGRAREPELVDTIASFVPGEASAAERAGGALFLLRLLFAGFMGTNRLAATAKAP